jgi:hypothetical protein
VKEFWRWEREEKGGNAIRGDWLPKGGDLITENYLWEGGYEARIRATYCYSRWIRTSRF